MARVDQLTSSPNAAECRPVICASRFWPADSYSPGGPQPSYDKQFVRDHLEACGWDKNSDPPQLPDDVVQKTAEK